LHRIRHQLLRAANSGENSLQVQLGYRRIPIARAVDSVLTDQRERVRECIECNGQTPGRLAPHEDLSLQVLPARVQDVALPVKGR
jgi:hypothetical protein